MAKITTVEVFKGKGGWYFHARAKNGEIGTQSEAYTRKASAVRAAKRWHPGVPVVVVVKK